MKRLVMTVVAVSMVAWSGVAWAGGGPTDEVACGSGPGGWNVPNGALVLSRTNHGMITDVLGALGEYYSHSMISHGPGYWMTHNTMHTPGTNDVCKACDNPLRRAETEKGYPGLSQANSGGVYWYNREADYIKYQQSKYCSDTSMGATVANWLWSSSKYVYTSSLQGSQGIYRLKWNDSSDYIHYYFYAYRNLPVWAGGGTASDIGNHCSGSLAWAQANALGSTRRVSYGTPAGDFTSYASSNLSTAAHALKNAVQDGCDDGLGFWSAFGAGFACFWCDFDTNICDDAGRQVGYCMMYGLNNCERGGNDWNVPSNLTAYSISPDRLGGWSGHPWVDSCSENSYEAVWAYDGGASPQWNGGGSTYGCYF